MAAREPIVPVDAGSARGWQGAKNARRVYFKERRNGQRQKPRQVIGDKTESKRSTTLRDVSNR
jgi:hypothetical protein